MGYPLCHHFSLDVYIIFPHVCSIVQHCLRVFLPYVSILSHMLPICFPIFHDVSIDVHHNSLLVPMVFLHFPLFSTIFQWFSQDVPVFPPFSHGFCPGKAPFSGPPRFGASAQAAGQRSRSRRSSAALRAEWARSRAMSCWRSTK